MAARVVDYLDEQKIKRRVLVPTGADPSEGIPLSLDVDQLYLDCPLEFRQRFVAELWAVGLIEKKDFERADAPSLIRSALLATVKTDTVMIINFARSQDNGKSISPKR